MLSCINKNSKEFRDLVQISELSENIVEAYCRYYSDAFGRFPYLDELPNSNSEQYLKEHLKLDSNNFSEIKSLLDYTGASDLQSAIQKINDIHRDLEVTGVQISDQDVILEIQHKPPMYSQEFRQQKELQNSHGTIILDSFCDKLQSLYGINIVSITNAEITQDKNLSQILDAPVAKAFIFNNTIYINTDNSTIDSRVHELLHLLFSTMRDVNPELYFNLISKAESFSNFDFIAKNYPNRTMGDLLEEVFVTELAKNLAGLNSSLSELSKSEYNEIHYQITRMLDTLFEGEISTKCIPDDELYNLTFGKVGQMVNSPITSYKFLGSLDQTKIHRILSNTKSQLLKDNRLKEICE